DDRDVDVVALPLVEQHRELALADQLGEAVRGGDVAGGQRREAGGVELIDLAGGRDLLAGAVDEEDRAGVGFLTEFLQRLVQALKLLFVQDQLDGSHGQTSFTADDGPVPAPESVKS